MADILRIFGQVPLENATIFLSSEEGAQMWRYLLRLNSTKMVPSVWQKENIPLGENTSLLATFISPLYDEFQLRSGITTAMNTNSSSSTTESVKKNAVCASCQKIPTNPKRCGRCKTIFYCSPECQRAHWTQHKIVCSPK